ncbi:flagellar basal body L-ring protein FlgH, partial [Candidatus Latescibacterota bacterium]
MAELHRQWHPSSSLTHIVLALACWLSAVPAMGQATSLFSDPKASEIGDALTVIIQENASATNQTATSTGKSNELEIASTVPGAGNILDFIPLHA